ISFAPWCMRNFSAEPSGNTLQPTALVHEAYLRLVGSPGGDRWDHRGHFFAAAEAMRRMLIDDARRKAAPRHGGAMRAPDTRPGCRPWPRTPRGFARPGRGSGQA